MASLFSRRRRIKKCELRVQKADPLKQISTFITEILCRRKFSRGFFNQITLMNATAANKQRTNKFAVGISPVLRAVNANYYKFPSRTQLCQEFGGKESYQKRVDASRSILLITCHCCLLFKSIFFQSQSYEAGS